jgi:serine acetyltransferase
VPRGSIQPQTESSVRPAAIDAAHGEPQRAAHTEGLRSALATYRHNLREDFDVLRRARAKYMDDHIAERAYPLELTKRIGLQTMAAIRTMHLFRDAGLGLAAQVTSRLIRHVYGAEIHWQSRWAPGVIVVHGNGLVVGSGANIESGCALHQNVTLGDAYDPATGRNLGPRLERDVHVGPGCSVIGSLTVGAQSKLMAGSVLDRSVEARSLVRPAPVQISRRAATEK